MIISVKNLDFEYFDKKALDNVSFEIGEGAITALVGPNGAGKTTLLRCLAALSKPKAGTVIINGIDASENPRDIHREVGYLSDFFGLYDQLTVRQSLEFMANSRIDHDKEIDKAIEKTIERSGVSDFINKKISSLSRGMRQRVGIAQAIIHTPKILLLDEPASGLDPEARHSLSLLMKELRDSGMVIIVSSHILAELEDYSNEMIVIQNGKLIEHKALSSVLSQLKNMLIKFNMDSGNFADIISGWEGIQHIKSIGTEIHLELNESVLSKSELMRKLFSSNMPVEEVTEAKIDLQEEYIRTVNEHKKKMSK
jgi:ABC-2 type transport system ATP-binding protein